eukprot:TRINITY_DN10434_c0_g1_i1.p1 TRINITY_DN10434_c0_g1~~TRINITY_DN10434_c0_g1_i1.p1  ORF type:complete len:108 (-),score=12.36 TRINITY_DN10434_c0_g1_i1:198-491(-)
MGNTKHPLSDAYAKSFNSAINNTQTMNNALETAPELVTTFSDSSVSQQLAAVAKAISVQSTLATQRQVFFVSMGGLTLTITIRYASVITKLISAKLE